MHLVCNCILIAFFWAFLLGVRNVCICRLCRLYAHYLSCTKLKKKTKCAISLQIFLKLRCAASLQLVCMHKVFTKCLHSLHKVCIYFHNLLKKVCIKCARCRLCRLGADFVDLVHQNPCSTRFGAPAVQKP